MHRPYYRISNFKSRQLFVNAYYAFDTESAWRPFVGVGVGVARFDTAFAASYLRRTVAEGYVAAVGGNPLQPEEWQIAAAGTTSSLDTELSDEVFGYRIAAGLERDLVDKARAFVMLRWSAFGDMRESAVWSTIPQPRPGAGRRRHAIHQRAGFGEYRRADRQRGNPLRLLARVLRKCLETQERKLAAKRISPQATLAALTAAAS